MKPELFHRWYDAGSDQVRDFIQKNQLDIELVEVDDDDLGSARLKELTGKEEIPALVTETDVVLEADKIIAWLTDHYLGQSGADVSAI